MQPIQIDSEWQHQFGPKSNELHFSEIQLILMKKCFVFNFFERVNYTLCCTIHTQYKIGRLMVHLFSTFSYWHQKLRQCEADEMKTREPIVNLFFSTIFEIY